MHPELLLEDVRDGVVLAGLVHPVTPQQAPALTLQTVHHHLHLRA